MCAASEISVTRFQLDPNFGLGPPSPFHGVPPVGDPRKAALRQQTLYDLGITALRQQQLVVELDEERLAQLESWSPSSQTAPESLDLIAGSWYSLSASFTSRSRPAAEHRLAQQARQPMAPIVAGACIGQRFGIRVGQAECCHPARGWPAGYEM